MNLSQIIKENQNFLDEGLIRSLSPNRAKDIFDRWSVGVGAIRGVDITKNGSLKIHCVGSMEDDTFNFMFSLMENYGYFCSAIQKKGEKPVKFNYDTYKEISSQSTSKLAFWKRKLVEYTLIFEAKYDKEVDIPYGEKLYHATSKSVVEKIKKIGLVPKTKSKLGNHPDRIYLTRSLQTAKMLAPKFVFIEPTNEFVILEIDTKELDFRHYIFYNDPNFNQYGVFTYKNIPPNAIHVLPEIYELKTGG